MNIKVTAFTVSKKLNNTTEYNKEDFSRHWIAISALVKLASHAQLPIYMP